MPPDTPGRGAWWLHLALVPALLIALALLAEASGLDRALSTRLYVARQGFVGASLPWMDVVGHRGARFLPIGVGLLALGVAAVTWRYREARRWRDPALLVAGTLVLITLVINVLKPGLDAHCPYQLDAYGGHVGAEAADRRPLWLPIAPDRGDCLPSAHAGGGYALLALYFAGWLAGSRRLRWTGLALGIVSGLVFSAVRISQGAHFASQTLWSAALAWTIAALLFAGLVRWRAPPATASASRH